MAGLFHRKGIKVMKQQNEIATSRRNIVIKSGFVHVASRSRDNAFF